MSQLAQERSKMKDSNSKSRRDVARKSTGRQTEDGADREEFDQNFEIKHPCFYYIMG